MKYWFIEFRSLTELTLTRKFTAEIRPDKDAIRAHFSNTLLAFEHIALDRDRVTVTEVTEQEYNSKKSKVW